MKEGQLLEGVIKAAGKIRREVGSGTTFDRAWRELWDGEGIIGVSQKNCLELQRAVSSYTKAVPVIHKEVAELIKATEKIRRADGNWFYRTIRRFRDGKDIVGVPKADAVALFYRVKELEK